ncbi:MAG TPA: hypothetical protein VKB52_11140 [Rhodanobacteraceae bacterium]|nr:hypothetical protein [Rhodanobacteraceae bacterium]
MHPMRTMILALALTIAACTAISVKNQWRDPAWPGPPAGNVVVVGIARNEATRRTFEDTFASELRKAGVSAESAYATIQPGENGKIKLSEFVRQSNADAVLTTRVQRVQQKVDVSPGYYGYPGYGGFYGWYGGAWAAAPMVSQYEVVTLETTVWDPRSEKLIWAATTERVASGDIPKVTTQLAETLIPRMKSDHILR